MDALKVLDTDVFIDHFRGLAAATAYIQSLPVVERATTDVTVMELYKGATNREQAHGLGIPDALIAARALEGDYTLVTSNLRHFRFIAGLRLEPAPYRRPQPDPCP
jgi:predicted nucleic acid-binding protein